MTELTKAQIDMLFFSRHSARENCCYGDRKTLKALARKGLVVEPDDGSRLWPLSARGIEVRAEILAKYAPEKT